MRARMSPLPVAKMPPVGLGATEMTVECQLIKFGNNASSQFAIA